jgi:enterochelin esterase-like enzyme
VSRTTVAGAAYSPALGEEIRYRVHLPTGGGTGLTSVYLLHGRGDGPDAWDRVVPALDRMVAERLVPPVLLVMPDAPWSGGGSFYVDSAFTGEPAGRPVETALTRDLVRHVDATYPTVADREHRVVGGYSMGGAGALRHLLAHPDLFSGGVVLSPAVYDPLPPADSSARELGAYGRGEERFVDEVYASLGIQPLLAAFDPALPVRLFLAAGDDHDLDREAALVHERAGRVPGISSRLRLLEGGHDWDVWEPALLEGLPHVLGADAGDRS